MDSRDAAQGCRGCAGRDTTIHHQHTQNPPSSISSPPLPPERRLPGSETPSYLDNLPASYGFDPLGLGE
jgi:hypothetical protein